MLPASLHRKSLASSHTFPSTCYNILNCLISYQCAFIYSQHEVIYFVRRIYAVKIEISLYILSRYTLVFTMPKAQFTQYFCG